MRDKSQIDDMRAALRGDLERARERRGATLLDREPEPEAPEIQEPEPRAEVSDTPTEAPEPQAPVSDIQEPAEIPEPAPKRRRFLWFLND